MVTYIIFYVGIRIVLAIGEGLISDFNHRPQYIDDPAAWVLYIPILSDILIAVTCVWVYGQLVRNICLRGPMWMDHQLHYIYH